MLHIDRFANSMLFHDGCPERGEKGTELSLNQRTCNNAAVVFLFLAQKTRNGLRRWREKTGLILEPVNGEEEAYKDGA